MDGPAEKLKVCSLVTKMAPFNTVILIKSGFSDHMVKSLPLF